MKIPNIILALFPLAFCTSCISAQQSHEIWLGAWASSPMEPSIQTADFFPQVTQTNGSVRYRLRLSAGGDFLRLVVTNEGNGDSLAIAAASIAAAAEGMNATPGTARTLTFAGQNGARLSNHSSVTSDPVEPPASSLNDILVTLYLPETTTFGPDKQLHAVSTISGSNATRTDLFPGAINWARPLVTRIDVKVTKKSHVIVTLGDSITDGFGSRPEVARGWPEYLSRRIADHGGAIPVVNAGIGGNRLLSDGFGPAALRRLDRDVFAVPGVTHVILLEGTNDIGMGGLAIGQVAQPMTSAIQIIEAYKHIIKQTHQRGIRIIGGTLTPTLGPAPHTPLASEKEVTRQEVNQWIRTSGYFDGVIDFDVAVRDPGDPSRLRDLFDSGDHLHLNDAGYRAMAAAVDLGLLN